MRSMQRTAAVGKTRRVAMSAPWWVLGEEAIWLARVLRDAMPDEPEVRGLLALLLHCEARRPARRGADGRYVPLSEQDPHIWLAPLIDEAEGELALSAAHARLGRFQIEAGDLIRARRARPHRAHGLGRHRHVL